MKARYSIPSFPGAAGTIGAVVLGAIFAWAGAVKVIDPAEFARTIQRYQLIPNAAVSPLAIILPWMEIIIGLGLAFSARRREAAATLALGLLCVFAGALVINWARGIDVDCGCFGHTGTTGGIVSALFRDAALTALALFVVWRAGPGRSPGAEITNAQRVPIPSGPGHPIE